MNRNLIKFEASKLSRHSLLIFLISVTIQLVFCIFFTIIGDYDKSIYEIVPKNVSGIVAISSVVTFIIIIVYCTVLMNKQIVENYTEKNRIRLYSFPNGRSVLFKAKIYAFIKKIIFLNFIGLLFANFLFWVITIIGDIEIESGIKALPFLFLLAINTALITLSLTLFSVSIGIRFSSTQLSLIFVIIMIAIFGNLIVVLFSSTPILSLLFTFLFITSASVVTYFQAHNIEKEDVL